MGPHVLAALRALPGVPAVFDALAGEPAVHVVGGAVRDVLLGRRPSELDLVVVGDGPQLARRLAARLGAELRVHERFGTATVSAGGMTLDVASARRESYPRPGALPDVTLGADLSADLMRRDFTVNAVAVSLARGAVTAHPAACSDLDARRLRVLHPGSFRDDPTRLLRLCRYAGRLDLAIEEETRRLAAAAIDAGCLDAVSGERLGRELRLATREPQPAVARELARTGVGEALLGCFAVDEPVLRRALDLCPADGRHDLLVLATGVATGAGAGDRIAARLSDLGFSREEVERVSRAAASAPALSDDLSRLSPLAWSRVAVRLDRETVEAIALAGALAATPVVARIVQRWLSELRHVGSELDGNDLRAAGVHGPAVGRGLRAARDVALDEPGAGREAQLRAALSAAAEPPRGPAGEVT